LPVFLATKYEQIEITKTVLVVGASVDHDRARGHAANCGMAIGDLLSSAMNGEFGSNED